MTSLKVDWCSFEAAKYACKNWHYSRSIPVGKLVKIGAWEDGKYIGCVLFGRGANKGLAGQFSLKQTECVELVRIAMTEHKTEVSRIVSIALKMLKKSQKIKLVVSFADKEQGHHGGIYQAGNWIYTGQTNAADEYIQRQKVAWQSFQKITRQSFRLSGQRA